MCPLWLRAGVVYSRKQKYALSPTVAVGLIKTTENKDVLYKLPVISDFTIMNMLRNFSWTEQNHWQVTVTSYCCIILAALRSLGDGIWSRFWRRFCLIAQDTNYPFGHSKHGFPDCSTWFCVLETLRKTPYSTQSGANQSTLQALGQYRD